jgi:5,10-methylenetetrahydromethanopterin reductase
MRIGIFSGAGDGGVDALVSVTRTAAEQGFASLWTPQIFSIDALTALAVVGREVPGIELGTAVVPTYSRHPWAMAQQAASTNAIAGGRLALGIGLSHQIVIEGMWGMSFAKPARHMREYLQILMPLVRGEGVNVTGETLTARGALSVPGATPFPVLIAALAPRMLELAGTLADGTITWCVGERTLGDYLVPAITAAADGAGRSVAPRVVAALPVCVTDDPAAARERALQVWAIYGQLPSYRAMLDKEGVTDAADIAIMGSEAEVVDRIGALAGMGVTDFAAVEFPGSPDEAERTRAALRSLV